MIQKGERWRTKELKNRLANDAPLVGVNYFCEKLSYKCNLRSTYQTVDLVVTMLSLHPWPGLCFCLDI